MLIVQYGQAKSGSSFIFQILTDLFQNRFLSWSDYMKNRNGFVPEKFHGDYIDLFNDEMEEIAGMVPKHEFFMLKTHSAPNQANWQDGLPDAPSEKYQDWLKNDHLKVIATLRDPRDMCLSYLDHAEAYRRGEKDFFDNKIYSVFDAIPNVQNEYRILKYWTAYSGVHWVSYPQICNEPFRILESMKKYIGLYHIDSRSFLEKLLENRSKIHQFNKGYVDRWKQELVPEDAEKLTQLLEPELAQYEKVCRRAEVCINLA